MDIGSSWLKQTTDKPLFGDLLWNRPENRAHAGKLLIVGGNKHAVAAPGMTFSAAQKAGAGVVRVLLPDSVRKTIGKIFPEAEFAPSTLSGSFSREALAQLLENARWADGVLLAGDFGRNSETAILLDTFADKYSGQLSIVNDALDYFISNSSKALPRQNTLLITDMSKLQKLAKNNRPSTPVLHSMNLHELVSVLTDWTNSSPNSFLTVHSNQVVVAYAGKACTTPIIKESHWQTDLAAYASVWWLQQPNKTFETLSTAIFDYIKN